MHATSVHMALVVETVISLQLYQVPGMSMFVPSVSQDTAATPF